MKARKIESALGQLCLKAGLMSRDQLHQALAHQAANGGRIGDVIVALGLATDEQIADLVDKQIRWRKGKRINVMEEILSSNRARVRSNSEEMEVTGEHAI